MTLRDHLPTAALCGATAVVCLAGGAAAGGLITGEDIKNRTVDTQDLATGAVAGRVVGNDGLTGAKIRDNTLTGADIDESTLELPDGGAAPERPVVYTWSAPFDYAVDEEWFQFSEMGLPPGSTVTARQFDVEATGCTAFAVDFSGGGIIAEAGPGGNGIRELGSAGTGRGVESLFFSASRNGLNQPCVGEFSFEFEVAENSDAPSSNFQ